MIGQGTRSSRGLVGSLVFALVLAGCQAAPAAPAAPNPAAPAPPPASAPPAAPATTALATAPATAPTTAPAAPAAAASQPTAPPAPAATQPPPPPPQVRNGVVQIGVGTSNNASSHYAYFVAVSKVINASTKNVNATASETGGAVDNANRIAKGDLHVGLSTVDVLYRMTHGLEAWQGKATPFMRWAWMYTITPQAIVVREDSGVRDVKDLHGKDFNPGPRGSGAEQMIKAVFAELGIVPKWYTGGTDDAIAAMRDKRNTGYVIGQAGPAQASASTLDIMSTTPVRLLGFTPDQLAIIKAKVPWYSPADIPPGTYKAEWNQKAITSLALILGGATSSTVPAETIYEIAKAVNEDAKLGQASVQGNVISDVRGADLGKLAIEHATVPLHAGAVKYYREIGLQPKPDQIPPEAR